MTEKKKRSRAKYPALKRELNLKSREDYIEPEYINGVRDSEGKLVIRPLTESEKKFLNDFYSETIVTDFLHHPELRQLNDKKRNLINTSEIVNLRKEINILKQDSKKNKEEIDRLKEIIEITKDQNMEVCRDKLDVIENRMKVLREQTLLYPDKEDHKVFYNDNNSRNNCLLNKLKSMRQLINMEYNLESILTDLEHSIIELSYKDNEDRIISDIERKKVEDEEDRLLKVLSEERLKK